MKDRTISVNSSAPGQAPTHGARPQEETGFAGLPARGRHQGKNPIRLLLVDDHPLVRKGLASCLSRHKHLLIAGEAADGREGVRKAKELTPDLVLMDLDMPNMDGLAATELLCREQPWAKVLIFTMHSNADFIARTIRSGARGYVLKESPLEELLEAIDAVESGEAFFSPKVSRLALEQFVGRHSQKGARSQLSAREQQVLAAIAEGLSNKEIASRTNVGVRTVETHRESIMRKLAIHSVAGLTKYALTTGLTSLLQQPSPTADPRSDQALSL